MAVWDYNENHDENGKFTSASGRTVLKSGPLEYKIPLEEYEKKFGDGYEGARAFFRNELQGKKILCKAQVGQIEVSFTGGTWQEFKKDMKKDALKREVLPLVPDILFSGTCHFNSSYKNRKDESVGFYSYEKKVKTTQGEKTILVDVAERPTQNPKNPVYSFVHESSRGFAKRREKESTSLPDSGQSLRDSEALGNDIVSDKNIARRYEIVNIRFSNEEGDHPMHREHLTFDSSPSRRHRDQNGYLHVEISNITKEQVAPYYGHEIPGWQELGLERNRTYYMYRPGEEIRKAVSTFNGIPLAFEHHPMSADDLPKEYIIGTVGTEGRYDPPYLKNSLVITDGEAIDAVERGEYRELSAAYQYTPVMKSGMFEGEHYDGVMTRLAGNHVALVQKGRAGHDVIVEDALPEGLGTKAAPMGHFRKERRLFMDRRTMRRIHRVMAYDAMPETEGMNVNLTAFMNAVQVIEAIKQGINPRSLGFELDIKSGVDDIVKCFFGSESPDRQNALREQLSGIMGTQEGADGDPDNDPDDDDFEEPQDPDDVAVKKDLVEDPASQPAGDGEEEDWTKNPGESDEDRLSHENSPFEDNPASDEDEEGTDPASGLKAPQPDGGAGPEDLPLEDLPAGDGEGYPLPGEKGLPGGGPAGEEGEEDYSEAMGSAGLDADDPASAQSFREGVKYARKLMREHEAQEHGPDHDRDHAELGKMLKMKKALDEKIEKAKSEMKEHYRAINRAAMDCRPVLGELRDPLAFDSAGAIYKKALIALGVDVKGLHPSAYAPMLKFVRSHRDGAVPVRTAMDSASVRDSAGKRALEALSRINVG